MGAGNGCKCCCAQRELLPSDMPSKVIDPRLSSRRKAKAPLEAIESKREANSVEAALGKADDCGPSQSARTAFDDAEPRYDDESRRSLGGDSSDSTTSDEQSMLVRLNVYDFSTHARQLNNLVRDSHLGAFHVGVEILGDEWCYLGFKDAFDRPEISGIVRSEPRGHCSGHLYRETVELGATPLSVAEVDIVIDDMVATWAACDYHPIGNNCATFAKTFAERLQCPEPFPDWIRGVAGVVTPELYNFAGLWPYQKRRSEAEEQPQQCATQV